MGRSCDTFCNSTDSSLVTVGYQLRFLLLLSSIILYRSGMHVVLLRNEMQSVLVVTGNNESSYSGLMYDHMHL